MQEDTPTVTVNHQQPHPPNIHVTVLDEQGSSVLPSSQETGDPEQGVEAYPDTQEDVQKEAPPREGDVTPSGTGTTSVVTSQGSDAPDSATSKKVVSSS